MARTDNDTWDLASSVGATATMVAVGRAVASRGNGTDRPLISDPFAEPLVRAVGVDLFSKLASGEISPADFGDGEGQDGAMTLSRMSDNMAVRTRFFDEFFLAACADDTAAIRQAVILASGLDARAYRLDWPAGTTVFEIDQPDVIEFKTRVLAAHGAQPTADRRPVAVDLRDDWPAALQAAGFDPCAPTAWSAEGLLAYLPAEAQDRLLDTVTALSAPGSRFAVECTPPLDPGDEDTARQRMRQAAEQMRSHGFDLDLTELVYFGDRNDAPTYLGERGWRLDSRNINELFAEHGLPQLEETDGYGGLTYVSAILEGER
ncbi:class I SAM-dependent methyltransferase [Mycolicibacter kumamotonensis]|jgi:methyltransferase (TIGR00027 family)|uniref:S-adenosyl-L-methionine-dependent methyltransferase n=1 Tax=Mycolicibacter kumamotonensis TaxID=354243 RepID=A0A1B8SJZ2_9MYCO|nr:class I SAM-dependent methyltransferase [Mycolicibacter kumamotonensis]NDJ91859.1 class I SAM-dependent methyltransferase [Mycolicibacter kumamotonensis]OBY33040.1 SAM-dependent methyltransferase [Mycolicibacter kumamotonensis]ORA81922.1 SAM-dependent methyltransferase [Mycolicibacter kumamotonensis]